MVAYIPTYQNCHHRGRHLYRKMGPYKDNVTNERSSHSPCVFSNFLFLPTHLCSKPTSGLCSLRRRSFSKNIWLQKMGGRASSRPFHASQVPCNVSFFAHPFFCQNRFLIVSLRRRSFSKNIWPQKKEVGMRKQSAASCFACSLRRSFLPTHLFAKTDSWSVQSPAPVFQQKHLAAKKGGGGEGSQQLHVSRVPCDVPFFAHPSFCKTDSWSVQSPAPVFQQKYSAAKKGVGQAYLLCAEGRLRIPFTTSANALRLGCETPATPLQFAHR